MEFELSTISVRSFTGRLPVLAVLLLAPDLPAAQGPPPWPSQVRELAPGGGFGVGPGAA